MRGDVSPSWIPGSSVSTPITMPNTISRSVSAPRIVTTAPSTNATRRLVMKSIPTAIMRSNNAVVGFIDGKPGNMVSAVRPVYQPKITTTPIAPTTATANRAICRIGSPSVPKGSVPNDVLRVSRRDPPGNAQFLCCRSTAASAPQDPWPGRRWSIREYHCRDDIAQGCVEQSDHGRGCR